MTNYITHAERLTEKTLNDLRKQLHERGGFTVLFNSESAGRYIVGVKGFTVHSNDLKLRHINQISVVTTITPGVDGFGAWLEDGIVHLDVIQTEDNKDSALNLARRHEQLAIYDRYTDETINVS